MGTDTGVYTLNELRSVDARGEALRDQVGPLSRVRPWWFAEEGADAPVLSAVRAGGVATCVTALGFYRRRECDGLWVPPDNRVHVRLSKQSKAIPRARRSDVVFCQGPGRPLPTERAVDSIPRALACAARCVPDDYWIAMCDSVLHHTQWTIPDLQAEMGVVSSHLRELFSRCDVRSDRAGNR